ncbi:MAG: GNAT family N-acetyltransferase [Desulfobacterales bacterium]|nr:GNAT family N-acetyltransferase [Desulfobacterales bacterium]
MASIIVRRLSKKDAAGIGRIDAAITKEASNLDYKRIVEEELKRETDASFVAEVGGELVGYMISYITHGNFGLNSCAWIAMFGVDPKCMGRGIGKRLAEEIFKFYKKKKIKNVLTSVRWDSTDLLSFFKALGFDRSDCVNLQKTLD